MDPIVLRMKSGTVTTITPRATRKPFVIIKFSTQTMMSDARMSIEFELSTENVSVLEEALKRAREFADADPVPADDSL